MLYSVIYLVALLALILFLIWFTVYVILLSYSFLKGAPYVPTQASELEDIFKHALQLLPANTRADTLSMLELGCGDGRVSLYATLYLNITSKGIDINPYLIWLARLKVWLSKATNIVFERQDIRKASFADYDIIYIFLLPALTQQIQQRIKKESKKDAVIISHGFAIETWEKELTHTRNGRKFKTYYYKLS